MKVAVYKPQYNEGHQDILESFAQGIPGAEIRWLEDFQPDSDVAVVFGWYKYAYQPTMKKKRIIDHYLAKRRLIIIESAFLKRKEYYQIGWNGFAGHADFMNKGMPMDRWKSMGILAKPWTERKDGLIVICGQLPRDTQVQDVDHLAWCKETFNWYHKAFGNRVVFRPHPRNISPGEYGIESKYFDNRGLGQVFSEASLVVTWNSTTGVEAAVAGIPVVAYDAGSMARPVAQTCRSIIPIYPVRVEWLAGIGYAQWTPHEMRCGLPWKHLNRSV